MAPAIATTPIRMRLRYRIEELRLLDDRYSCRVDDAELSVQQLLDELHAFVLTDLCVGIEATIKRHAHLPRSCEDFRILDRHLVHQMVRTDRSIALGYVQRVAMKIPGPIEPGLFVEV